jgi:hypothetical protein
MKSTLKNSYQVRAELDEHSWQRRRRSDSGKSGYSSFADQKDLKNEIISCLEAE